MTKQLRLRGKFGRGKFALVSDEVFNKCKHHQWWVRGSSKYVATTIRGKIIELQNFVVDFEKNPVTLLDHINGDRFDNTFENLRVVTVQQNNFNTAVHSDSVSGYKGVSAFRGKWRARITIDGKLKYLGVYEDVQDAARAYDKAAMELYGEFARLNFPGDKHE